jgi:murein DD-endopeptidase MepM/ murein hydrolase activator NlpD
MSPKHTKKKANRRYTVMLVPEGNERTFAFPVHRSLLGILLAALAIFVLGLTVLLFKAGDIGLKLQLVNYLREENARLRIDNERLRTVSSTIDSMAHLIAYLERLATAVGVEAEALSPPPASVSGEQNIFTKDRHDRFLDDVRGESSPGEMLSEKASSSDYLSSIPNIRPVEGWVTRRFGVSGADGRSMHNGVDFAAATGTLIRSTAPGIVDSVMHDTYFGLMVSVKHKHGFTTRYAHCSQILVSPGDRVGRGQTVALVGNSGRSSAPHLHYEILRDGAHVDPLKYILDHTIH